MLAVAQQQTFHYPDMDFELDGATLHYERRGDGRPLLLLHGGTGVADDWKHVFPEPPAGFELIAPDLRGHGRSGNPKGAFTIGQIADDVLALLEHLSIGRCDAIGMSLGAKALLHAASKRPEVIGAMVLVSGAAYFPESARRIMAQMSPDAYDDEQLDAMREKHVLGDEQILALWRQMRAFKDSY
ncbi:MAG: alpha/beta fold hydrolase, partial [Pseudomonadota bacterium]